MDSDAKEHAILRDQQIKELSDSLSHLQGRNSVLEELFKGRDPSQDNVFKQAPEIFAIARETNSYSKANSEAIAALTHTLEIFIKQIGGQKPTV